MKEFCDFLTKYNWKFDLFCDISLDVNVGDLVQIRYVEPVGFKIIGLSGIKYLQFLGKHLTLGEEQSWSEDGVKEERSPS